MPAAKGGWGRSDVNIEHAKQTELAARCFMLQDARSRIRQLELMLDARGDFLCVSPGRSSVRSRAQLFDGVRTCSVLPLDRLSCATDTANSCISVVICDVLMTGRALDILLGVFTRGRNRPRVCTARWSLGARLIGRRPRKKLTARRDIIQVARHGGPLAAAARRAAQQPRHDDRRLAASHAHRADGRFAGPAHADCDLVESLPPGAPRTVPRSPPEHRARPPQHLAGPPKYITRAPEHCEWPPKPQPGASS